MALRRSCRRQSYDQSPMKEISARKYQIVGPEEDLNSVSYAELGFKP